MKIDKKQYTALLDLLCHRYEDDTIVTFPVLSGSMLPLMTPGDSVEIKPVNWKKCHIGDIIVFKDGFKLITHRLLFKAAVGEFAILFQKGDNSKNGNFISKDQIVGKVILIRKKNNLNISLLDHKIREEARLAAYKLRVKTIFILLKEIIKGVTGWKTTNNANALYKSEKQI